MRQVNIFIPYTIEFFLIQNNKNNILYLNSENLYAAITIKHNNILINESTNTIRLLNNNTDNLNGLFNNDFNKFLFSWDNYFYNKVKFTGKGFKFKKKETNLFLFFNRAHKCFFIGNNIILIRLSKNKVILLKNNINHIIYDSNLIRKIRANNIFTKRGLRFSRQIILKKRGKTATH